MTHTEYEWLFEGKKVYAQSWLTENTPMAIICLLHGLGEHSGRYDRWGNLFAKAGYGLMGMDILGNGKTEGKTGHIPSYESLLDQVDLMLSKSEEMFPGIPKILYGHSMGGNIGLNYAISRNPQISALIASSPWLILFNPVEGPEKLFAGIFNSLAPGLIIKAGRVGAEKLSHDPEHWESVRNDPVMHNKVSIRYGHQVNKMGEHALLHAEMINIPLLLIHGDSDEITSHRASEEFAAKAREKIHLKIWKGLRHELHNEPEHGEVFEFIINWLKEQGL